MAQKKMLTNVLKRTMPSASMKAICTLMHEKILVPILEKGTTRVEIVISKDEPFLDSLTTSQVVTDDEDADMEA